MVVVGPGAGKMAFTTFKFSYYVESVDLKKKLKLSEVVHEPSLN